MTNQPETAWVEAARQAAADVYEAFGDMSSLDLQLSVVPLADASATNSCDRSFLDMLKKGEHLGPSFLQNA